MMYPAPQLYTAHVRLQHVVTSGSVGLVNTQVASLQMWPCHTLVMPTRFEYPAGQNCPLPVRSAWEQDIAQQFSVVNVVEAARVWLTIIPVGHWYT